MYFKYASNVSDGIGNFSLLYQRTSKQGDRYSVVWLFSRGEGESVMSLMTSPVTFNSKSESREVRSCSCLKPQTNSHTLNYCNTLGCFRIHTELTVLQHHCWTWAGWLTVLDAEEALHLSSQLEDHLTNVLHQTASCKSIIGELSRRRPEVSESTAV